MSLVLGGFEIGDSSDEPVINLVERSIAIDAPVIVVSPNYRVNGHPLSYSHKTA